MRPGIAEVNMEGQGRSKVAMQELEGFSQRCPVFRFDAEIPEPWVLEMNELAAGGNRGIDHRPQDLAGEVDHQRPEDVLPAQQTVRENVQPGLLLHPHERRKVLGEGRLHRVGRHPAAVETAGRRHDLLGPWIDPVLIRVDVDSGEFTEADPIMRLARSRLVKGFGVALILGLAGLGLAGCGSDGGTTYVLQSESPSAGSPSASASASTDGSPA